jgi:uncharacterized membrane protein YtjA (UPF0391 family)
LVIAALFSKLPLCHGIFGELHAPNQSLRGFIPMQNATSGREPCANCGLLHMRHLVPLLLKFFARKIFSRRLGRTRRMAHEPLTTSQPRKEHVMLGLSIAFLLIALIAAVLGFGVIAGTAAAIAKVLFVIFLVLFLVSLIGRGSRGV